MNILEIHSDWKSPASTYPLKKSGKAKLSRVKYHAGTYRMEGVDGYDYFEVKDYIFVTCLKIGREVVMVDDVLHWQGMKALAKCCKGKVLVAGLGMGLIVHALVDNSEVTEIKIIERNEDVINLTSPLIPKDCRITIKHEDFYDYMENNLVNPEIAFDYIIIDIFWGNRSREIYVKMMNIYTLAKVFNPAAQVYIWGHKDPSINPAVLK